MNKLLFTFLSVLILISIVSCKKSLTDFPSENNLLNAENPASNHPGFGNGNLPLIAYERKEQER